MVRTSAVSLSPDVLRRAAVLVTANAREAFSPSEVTAVRDWLHGGGALLLIVDHPPFVHASADLALALGIHLTNTGVGDPNVSSGRLVFRRSDRTLADHVITIGIDSVATFTGSSLQLGANGQPLLLLGPHVRAYDEKGEPDPSALVRQLQGGVLEVGRGRVAVFGEAAMFSAQLSGASRATMGMNAPIARQNAPFLLNVFHWLTRRL